MGLLNPPASGTAKFEEADDTPAAATKTSSFPSSQTKPAQKGPSKMATNVPTTRVTTGVIRGSYVKIFKAELAKNAKDGDTPKFSMTLLIDKNDAVTLGKIAAAQEAAVALKWPNKRPPKLTTTLHDGDQPREKTGEDYGPECKGCMVMTVSSKFKPKLIDRDSNEIIDPSQVGSGDYFKVSINFYGFDANGNRGVSAGLNNVLFWEKGESLGGMSSPEEDFADDLNQG